MTAAEVVPALPARVAVIELAPIATLAAPDAGAAIVNVGVGRPTVVDAMLAPQVLAAALSVASAAKEAYHQYVPTEGDEMPALGLQRPSPVGEAVPSVVPPDAQLVGAVAWNQYLKVSVPVVWPELPASVARIDDGLIAVPAAPVSGDVIESVGDHFVLRTWVVDIDEPHPLSAAAFVPSLGIEANHQYLPTAGEEIEPLELYEPFPEVVLVPSTMPPVVQSLGGDACGPKYLMVIAADSLLLAATIAETLEPEMATPEVPPEGAERVSVGLALPPAPALPPAHRTALRIAI